MLNKVKLMLGLTDNEKDDLITLLIENAQEEAYQFCFMDQYDVKLDRIVLKMVLHNYARLGNEGIASTAFGVGMSESYFDGYTKDIVDTLKTFRLVKLL